MTSSQSDNLERGLRWFLAALLLWAAVSKLANPTEFLGAIYAYDLPLPRALLQTTVVVLPWIELLCGLLLLVDVWRPTALVAATGLMIFFVLATGQAWVRGLNISCGCFNLEIFGLNERLPGLVHFLETVAFAFFRNLLLTALAAFLLRRTWRTASNGSGVA
jgi:putative oxidoreductase